MKIHVRLYGWFRDYFKVGSLTLELESGAYEEFAKELSEALNDSEGLLVEGGGLREDEVIVAVNGEVVSLPSLSKTGLKHGDIVDIMPLPSGG